MKAAFDLFDVDGTQRINPRDLSACVQSLNLRRNQVGVQLFEAKSSRFQPISAYFSYFQPFLAFFLGNSQPICTKASHSKP